MADKLDALLDEFQAAISQGHVPTEFAARLAKIRQDAEGLIDD